MIRVSRNYKKILNQQFRTEYPACWINDVMCRYDYSLPGDLSQQVVYMLIRQGFIHVDCNQANNGVEQHLSIAAGNSDLDGIMQTI